MTHPFPKAKRATSLKLAMRPSSPGRWPTSSAHRLRSQRPKVAVLAEKRHDTMPLTMPMLANAAGKASAPEPMIVLARLDTELRTEAPG